MILLGPSSLDSAPTQRSGPKGYAHQWEIKSVTPGCIAMAAVVVSSSHFYCPTSLTISIQAQFIISPDRLFAERGAISKTNYRDRFKQYKKLIIKNIDSPQMKVLLARLNAQLFQVHSQDEKTLPVDHQEETEDEDAFSRAFQEQVNIGTLFIFFSLTTLTLLQGENESTTNTPAQPTTSSSPPPTSVPMDDEPTIAASNLPAPSLPINPGEPPTVPDDEVALPTTKPVPGRRSTRSKTKRVGNKAP